jgi:6,7-dimethyl-8-ribityllumazine synthase
MGKIIAIVLAGVILLDTTGASGAAVCIGAPVKTAAGSTSQFLVFALAAGHSLSNTSRSGAVAVPNAIIPTRQQCSHACERSKGASPEMFGKGMLRGVDSYRPAY